MSYEFIHMTLGRQASTVETVVSEEHANRLLEDHTTDSAGAVARLKNNPWGQLVCEGGTIYARPVKEQDHE